MNITLKIPEGMRIKVGVWRNRRKQRNKEDRIIKIDVREVSTTSPNDPVLSNKKHIHKGSGNQSFNKISEHDCARYSSPAVMPPVSGANLETPSGRELEGIIQLMEEMKTFMETEFECVRKEKINTRAEQFEHTMITWMPCHIYQWWGFKPDMVAKHKISITHPVGYGPAFARAEAWFANARLKLFRDIHAAVHNKQMFHMFNELEYDGIGCGSLSNNDAANFESTTNHGASIHKNVLVVEISMKNLNVSLQLVCTWLQYCKEVGSDPDMLDGFKKICVDTKLGLKEFKRFLDLLRALIQLEKKLVLQVFRHNRRFNSVQDLHGAMRAVIVCYNEPPLLATEVLLTSTFASKVFPTIANLFKYNNFKLLAFEAN